MTRTLYAAALGYAGRGWPVFPVVPGGKLPLVPSAHPVGDPLRGSCRGECGRDGHGLYDASTDPEHIASWWTTTSRANVGLRTGVAFDVLDVDVKDADGIATLASLLDEHGCLPPVPSVATPSGGLHYYFRPTGAGNGARFLPGLDWRGAGGYVVAPPSNVDGKPYDWGVGPNTELCDAPAWLVALLKPRTSPAPARNRAPAGTAVRSPSAYAQRALEAEVGRLLLTPEGARNDALNRAAYYLGQLVAAGALDAREVVEALVVAAERIGLEAGEIHDTIESGLNRGMAKPRRLPA